MKPIVSIIMGSTSDLPIMEKAAAFFDSTEIPFEMLALSAHRTPREVEQFASSAKERGIKVIIAGAGMAAHLGGVIASLTTLPVIGVPIRSSFDGKYLPWVMKILTAVWQNTSLRSPTKSSRQTKSLGR